MTKIIFAGSGHGGIAALKSLQEYFTYIEVITDDFDVISILRDSDKQIASLSSSSTNLVVCAGYHEIIKENILKEKTIINTHPSLLPKYRGMHGLAWAMLNFESELGFTIHLMNKYIDDGDILEQYKVKYEDQTSQEIMILFDTYVRNNLGRVVVDYLSNNLIPLKQDKSKATWVAKRNIDDCIIDFGKSNLYIDRLFKVLVEPYPLPILKIGNILYEILDYELIEINYYTDLGRVVNIEDNNVYIKVKDGLLIINNLRKYKTEEKVKASEIMRIGKRL